MSDAELWAAWRLWTVLAAVIVLIAAGLLVAIWTTARSILAEAHRALAAAERIQRNTQAIWELDATNAVARRIHESVEGIAQKGGALVGALERSGSRIERGR
jgi:hypothetical protein